MLWNMLVSDFDVFVLTAFGVVVLILVLIQLEYRRHNDKDGKQRLALVFLGPGFVWIPLYVIREGLRMQWVNDTHWRVLSPEEEGVRWVWRWTKHPYRITKGEVVGNVPSRASK